MSKVILGVKLNEREKDATKFQDLLSQYGSIISTRIGLHDASDEDSTGVILLQISESADSAKFEKELSVFPNAKVQKMVF